MSLRIAYVVNQYPKVSHSFIRREILALERQGADILRISLQGWDDVLVDKEDREERERTRYVLQDGYAALLLAALRMAFTAPVRFFGALALAIRMARRGARPLPYHLAYLAEACRIMPWLKSFGATHVHAHFATNSAEVAMLANALGGPSYSFTVHGSDEFDTLPFIGIRDKVLRAAIVVSVSSFGRSQLYRWIDHSLWQRVKVVRCGLERAFYDVEAVPIRQDRRLVCVGRMCNEKGQLLLVEAMYRLAQKGIVCELVLAGDGEMRDEVEELIRERHLEDRISITGWLTSDQVREQILAARGLVLPSFFENLPVVIMEAMALRRPVLATYVGGIPELVRPRETGWLFASGSLKALTEALEDFLATPDDELRRMGEAGYARVVQDHSIDTEAAKLVELFGKS
ncbi:MAG TPA: glycosyltransferase family 4 protein [Burkholderiales bacterium]|nr:glycosyltransferase family 4 protein [Burkholderiales bacterium]